MDLWQGIDISRRKGTKVKTILYDKAVTDMPDFWLGYYLTTQYEAPIMFCALHFAASGGIWN